MEQLCELTRMLQLSLSCVWQLLQRAVQHSLSSSWTWHGMASACWKPPSKTAPTGDSSSISLSGQHQLHAGMFLKCSQAVGKNHTEAVEWAERQSKQFAANRSASFQFKYSATSGRHDGRKD